MDSRFKIAHEKAELVIDQMSYSGGPVDINKVIQIIEKENGVDIKIAQVPFSKIEGIDKQITSFGAAMSVIEIPKSGERSAYKQAKILLNLDIEDSKLRRFSLAHELGHVITGKYNLTDSDNHFNVSTHINPDITSIDESKLDHEMFVNEQIANVFALLVLMPKQAFVIAVDLLKSNNAVADYFGVSADAVKSRRQLIENYGD